MMALLTERAFIADGNWNPFDVLGIPNEKWSSLWYGPSCSSKTSPSSCGDSGLLENTWVVMTSSSASFCVGGAMIMGGNGLSLTGSNAEGDCLMLWTEAFTVNTLERAVVANFSVFFLALLAQFLTTTNANRMQRAKHYTKRQRALALTALKSDIDSKTNGYATTSEWRRDPSKVKDPQETLVAPALILPMVSHWEHLGDSIQHGCRIMVAYLLMLAAMTYDIGLITSTVAGFMVGYFFFTKDTTKVPASADPCCS